jgi:hypothetical protein
MAANNATILRACRLIQTLFWRLGRPAPSERLKSPPSGHFENLLLLQERAGNWFGFASGIRKDLTIPQWSNLLSWWANRSLELFECVWSASWCLYKGGLRGH